MLSKILPAFFLVLGAGAGVAVGILIAPHSTSEHGNTGEAEIDADQQETEFIKLNNQFVVPVVTDDRIEALVVVSLSLETTLGMREKVYSLEPRLRDAFLRVMFDHANMGGFRGAFTQPDQLDPLRTALREVARKEIGKAVHDVLIVDIVRQDA